MELGTEDICLESGRTPGGVVQRFGNEGPRGFGAGQGGAGGFSLMFNSGARKAIVKVRRSGNGSTEDNGVRSSSQRPLAFLPSDEATDPLENRFTLRHIREVASLFLASVPSFGERSASPKVAQFPSATDVTDGIPCSDGDGGITHALMRLQQQCETDSWLRQREAGCSITTDAVSRAVWRPKVPLQFSHIASTTTSHQSSTAPKRAAPIATKEMKSGETAPTFTHDTHDDDDEGEDALVTQMAARFGKVNTRAQATQSLMQHLSELPQPSFPIHETLFVSAVCSVVPGATEAEARHTFRTIDVGSRNVVTWDDFLSFLVSRNTGAGGASNPALAQSSELLPISMPRSCPLWYRHEKNIQCMAVSPTYGTVFTGGRDGALRSWDGTTLKHVKLWFTCPSWIVAIALTHREQRLIVSTVDRQLVVFDAKTADVLRIYRGRRVLETENGVSFAHDSIPTVTIGGKIVSHAAPKNIRIRRTGAEMYHRDTSPSPSSQGAAKGNAKLALSYDEHKAKMLEEKSNVIEKRRLEELILAGLTEAPCCMEYHYSHDDEDVIFFGMEDGSIRLYMLPAMNQQRLVRRHWVLRPHHGAVRMMKVLPSLDGLMSCSDDGTVKLTHLETGTVLKTYGGHVRHSTPAASAGGGHSSSPQATAASTGFLSPAGHEGGVHTFAYSATLKLFVTTGTERHGVVWDPLQETPVATLDEHACPALCCCINEAELQLITVGADNSVLVFDARSYRLLQSFHERPRAMFEAGGTSGGGQPSAAAAAGSAHASAGGPNGGTVATTLHGVGQHHLFLSALFDVPRQRLLVATLFPAMHPLRRMVATLPPTYCGHTSPVVALVYNQAFDTLMTIDAEHLVLGWQLETGRSTGLSFSIDSFAPSAQAEDLRLTCCSLDVMERRLITGFSNGTVVVWNAFNGQALCVIRAAASLQSASSTSSLSTSGVALSEVIAVASLQRDVFTHYLFAVGDCLVPLQDTSTFTVANPTRWRIPEALGVVTCLQQCSSVLMACGTTSGALLFYNCALESPDGFPVLVEDSQPMPYGQTSPSPQQRLSRSTTPAESSGVFAVESPPPAATDTGSARSPPKGPQSGGGSAAARIVSLFVLRNLPHTILTVHSDGRIAAWQSLRRLYVNGTTLCGPNGPTAVRMAALSACEHHLVVADDGGILMVFALQFTRRADRSIEATDTEHQLYALGGARRVSSFFGRSSAITGIACVRRAAAHHHDSDADAGTVVSNVFEAERETFIVTTSADFFTRVFTCDGVFVGELGMNRWELQDPQTFKEKPTPCASPALLPTSSTQADPAEHEHHTSRGATGDLVSVLKVSSSAGSAGAASPASQAVTVSTRLEAMVVADIMQPTPAPPAAARQRNGEPALAAASKQPQSPPSVAAGTTSPQPHVSAATSMSSVGTSQYRLPPALAAACNASTTPQRPSPAQPTQPTQPMPIKPPSRGGQAATTRHHMRVVTSREGILKKPDGYALQLSLHTTTGAEESPSNRHQDSQSEGGALDTRASMSSETGGLPTVLRLSSPTQQLTRMERPERRTPPRVGGTTTITSSPTSTQVPVLPSPSSRANAAANATAALFRGVAALQVGLLAPSSARKPAVGDTQSPSTQLPHLPSPGVTVTPTSVTAAALTVGSEAGRTKLLTLHLDQQLGRLRQCKSNLNDELRRIEARMARSKQNDDAVVKAGSSSGGSSGGPNGGGGHGSSWTTRVAARLALHDIDDIQPPTGSKAGSEAGRRTYQRLRLTGANKAGGGGGASSGRQAVEFFPSVTAPGTIVIGNGGGGDEMGSMQLPDSPDGETPGLPES